MWTHGTFFTRFLVFMCAIHLAISSFFLVRVSTFFSYFLHYPYFSTFLSKWSLKNLTVKNNMDSCVTDAKEAFRGGRETRMKLLLVWSSQIMGGGFKEKVHRACFWTSCEWQGTNIAHEAAPFRYYDFSILPKYLYIANFIPQSSSLPFISTVVHGRIRCKKYQQSMWNYAANI